MATTTTTPVLSLSRSLEWSPVIAGSLVAGAISLVLIQFGNGIGLSFTNINENTLEVKHVIAIALWVIWVQLIASGSGGYLAGRLVSPWSRTHEGELRDGAHGLLVWALSSVITAVAIGAAAAISAALVQHGAEPEVVVPDAVAHKAAIITGFGIAASSLVSAVIAWAMASLGGHHRDSELDVSRHTTFRTVRKS